MVVRIVSMSFYTTQAFPFHIFVSGGDTEVSTQSWPSYGFSGGDAEVTTSQMLMMVN